MPSGTDSSVVEQAEAPKAYRVRRGGVPLGGWAQGTGEREQINNADSAPAEWLFP